MKPPAALERIAYLLDRAREKSYRVRAYLRAAEIVKALTSDELLARVNAGTLEELDGIGPKTAAIITDVASSGSSAYLDKLEDVHLDPGEDAERRQLVVQRRDDVELLQ